MSIVFLIAFIYDLTEQVPLEYISTDFFVVWALFAIADALWFRKIKWWEDKDG